MATNTEIVSGRANQVIQVLHAPGRDSLSQFEYLPDEIINLIIDCLDQKDLARLSLSSKEMNKFTIQRTTNYRNFMLECPRVIQRTFDRKNLLKANTLGTISSKHALQLSTRDFIGPLAIGILEDEAISFALLSFHIARKDGQPFVAEKIGSDDQGAQHRIKKTANVITLTFCVHKNFMSSAFGCQWRPIHKHFLTMVPPIGVTMLNHTPFEQVFSDNPPTPTNEDLLIGSYDIDSRKCNQTFDIIDEIMLGKHPTYRLFTAHQPVPEILEIEQLASEITPPGVIQVLPAPTPPLAAGSTAQDA